MQVLSREDVAWDISKKSPKLIFDMQQNKTKKKKKKEFQLTFRILKLNNVLLNIGHFYWLKFGTLRVATPVPESRYVFQ